MVEVYLHSQEQLYLYRVKVSGKLHVLAALNLTKYPRYALAGIRFGLKCLYVDLNPSHAACVQTI
jgi:hypothetical protein